MAAVFDIEIKARWIPSEGNAVADASRHDFKKLISLGFKEQVTALHNRPSAPAKMTDLRRQLSNFFGSRSPPLQGQTTIPSEKPLF